ncbi:acyltransferase family protein [Flavobacterium sp. 7A]|uniref:acyltransferase family protein n=1 Tax=Flavobacterium sp. 7A TaxID=2940571 RepID=UPI002227153C|nr:acyltransferase [Flavobacterium sp. 7A]MCW2118294.1 peptidoglycan/LPS O-acetylase OafA/YrhL [Flavobacterium sp. 7A]
MKHLPNLTAIRFILSILVVIFHIPQFFENRGFPFYNDLAIFKKGGEAVCVFFSLSGFLIIKQLYEEKKIKNTINIKYFFTRRALRIFPLYYLVLIFGFLYYRTILPYFGYNYENNYDLITGLLLSVTFFSNIFCSYGPGGILEILWSIAIEEQFYFIIAPAFFILPFKKIPLFLVLFTVAFILMYFSENFIYLVRYQMLFFYFSFSGLFAILLNQAKVQYLFRRIRYPILIVVLLYFGTSIFKNNLNNISYHLFSMVLFGLAISILSQKPIKILENRTINYLGKISYGIYMFHPIIMQFIGLAYLKVIQKLNLSRMIDIVMINFLIITITIIVAHLSFKYYESYFLNLKKRFRAVSK